MRLTLAVTALIALALPATAEAFCGFYVAGSNNQLFNDATQVVLMRRGTRTVLSMQNNYQGPPEAFALVVPVPVVLKEQDVKTLPKDVFARVETIGAPRLVEYWEQDPCAPDAEYEDMPTTASLDEGASGAVNKPSPNLGVKVEAKFTVGEYQIVILSAKDSTGLDTWLRQEKYNIPAGAEPLLRPYVESGLKFFVAKVDPARVTFEGNRAVLSPLRFHYDAEQFTLPIRLGLANSSGTQDLIVNILSPQNRYQLANYPNVTIPTNIDVKPSVKNNFAAFYAALFDATVEKHKGAVVTEYAWDASTCDPCPGPALDYNDLATLGADVLDGPREQPKRYSRSDFVLTRLHARYGKDLKDDLVFSLALPIVGGREHVVAGGKLEEGARSDTMNNFQGRYAIRYPWTGPIRCNDPKRGRWGGPPRELLAKGESSAPKPALNLAAAPRGQAQLASLVAADVQELGLKAGGVSVEPPPAPGSATPPAAGSGEGTSKKKTGCGCQTSGHGDVLALVGLALVGLRRRRRKA
jgi:MYXO-CTERM domain-containing protein